MSGDVAERDDPPLVIHLDDDDAFLGACKRFLEKHDLSVRTTTSPSEALEHLEEIDCVVSDYDMPAMNGIEFLEQVRERDEDIPFILFTGKGSEEIAGEAISAGVTDYLQKGTGSEQFTVLANRIDNAIERYRAEQRAAESDQRIRRVYERIDDGFVALDTDWRYTYVNERGAELLNRSPEEMLGTTVWEAFPSTVGSNFESALREARETSSPTSLEEFYAEGGQWLELRIFPDDSGISVYFRDITDRKERERRYDAIFNQTFQFTGLMKPDGTLIEANETALQFAGVDREDVVEKPLWETYWFQLNEETRSVARESVKQAAKGEFYRQELRVQGADRKPVIDFSVRPVTDRRGEVTLLVPEGRDISELKEREEELKEERAFARSIFAALPDAFYAFDGNGAFLRWNHRFVEVTGYTDDEVETMVPTDFIAPPDRQRVAEAIAEVFTEDHPVSVEARFETKDGEWIPYEFTGAQLKDDDGETLGLVGIGRDISELKERERELERKNEQLEEFASIVSHDLKNPLTVAKGNAELARETGDLDRLDDVETALNLMSNLVDDVLDLARKGQVVDDPEPVDIRGLVDEIASLSSLDVETEGLDGAVVAADRTRLSELLSNLLENAANHALGPVTIGLEGDVLYVADRGPGIPPEERDRVFTPGHSSDPNGTGFGLAIARNIADAHGWEVSVTESAYGGSRFEFTGLDVRFDE
jgi:PAS domain S-box-containing protein